MAEKFDKFTVEARKTLTDALSESMRFRHNYVGTEHLVLSLIELKGSFVAKVLAEMSVNIDQARRDVAQRIGKGEVDNDSKSEIGMTPRAKKVINLAVQEAQTLGHKIITAEHLMFGIIRENEGNGAQILVSQNVDLELLRIKMLGFLELFEIEKHQEGMDQANPYRSILQFMRGLTDNELAQVPKIHEQVVNARREISLRAQGY